jgi:hypothetical protein
MAANGNVSVFVMHCFLLHRSRLVPAPAPGPAREPDLPSLLAESCQEALQRRDEQGQAADQRGRRPCWPGRSRR